MRNRFPVGPPRKVGLGKPRTGLEVIRADFEGLQILPDAVLRPAAGTERGAQVPAGGRHVRVEGERFAILSDGLVGFPQFLIGDPGIVIDVRKAGAEQRSLPVEAQGFFLHPLARKACAEALEVHPDHLPFPEGSQVGTPNPDLERPRVPGVAALGSLFSRFDVDPAAVPFVPGEAVAGHVCPPERDPQPLAEGQKEEGQPEAVPALVRDHPIQEIIIGVPGGRIVGKPLLGEQHPVDGVNRQARLPPPDQGSGYAPGDPVHFLFDKKGIRAAAGKPANSLPGCLEKRRQQANLIVGQPCDPLQVFLDLMRIALYRHGGAGNRRDRRQEEQACTEGQEDRMNRRFVAHRFIFPYGGILS
ncbi:MAG TPA: hypothetical protein VFF01_02145 [Candidatus Deferrimicrobiaceae bacterium]|nr:hypothetical protein [Candidatus Deferrimicrobiaceae bacterium]